MHILFADSVDETMLQPLVDAGCSIAVEPGFDSADLERQLADVDVLVVRSTKVTAAAMKAANQLKLIVRAGAGTDTIDKQAAADAGVAVCNVPGRNSVAVAELTMGLLLAIDRRIPDCTADLRRSVWNKSEYSKAEGLMGKTMGIIGFGAIGQAVAVRAAAFGMRIVVQTRQNRSDEANAMLERLGIVGVDSHEALLAECDVLTLHVPGGDRTEGMVNAELLGQLRPGAILLNTTRGSTMIAADLIEALDGGLRAGLDVFPDEPPSGTGSFESKLASHPNVVGTHHIGASTEQAQQAVADGTIAVILAFTKGETLHCVNHELMSS